MAYAFLFLTYDNIIKDYNIDNINIYIHAKYPEKVNKKYKKYIIKNLIKQTDWCEYSIVKATINLLKEALINKSNKWFVLLSQDSYPIYNNFFEKFEQLHDNKSIFNYVDKYNDYYKTSQWWILNREDANIIINNELKYDNKFQHKIQNGCHDEYYFLSVLMWNNPMYKYTNSKIMYDKWLEYTIQKSPAYFNHLLKQDFEYINENKCLFIRKITDKFSLNIYKTKRKLYVIYIGTETNQDNIIFNEDFDFILIISIDINDIKKEIVNNCIYIFNIIYKFFYETILNICNEKFITNWDLVIFTTEKFNMNNYNSIDKVKKFLPYNKFKFKNKSLENKKFYFLNDSSNENAYCVHNL